MRKILLLLHLIFLTLGLCVAALCASLFEREGKTVHRLARFWARTHLNVCGISIAAVGLENIAAPPYIFMCNHQSALDIFALLTALPVSFKWVAKRELFRIPFVGWCMRRAGYISLDRANPREALKAIEDAATKIRAGTNIIIFPEGTRSVDGVLLPFKKGAFSLALRAKVPIVPIGIQNTNKLQPKGSFIPNQKGVIYISVGKPVETALENRSAKTNVMLHIRSEIERLMGAASSDNDNIT